MNLAQFVKTLSNASARTAEKTSTKSPFKFYNLKPRQQEKIVRSANYKLGRDPRTIDFDIKDKELLNSIQERMNNYSFMNNLKNGKQIEGYSSVLDKKADEFLAANADKISKDLEEYSTIPLDYEDSANRIDLSKFVDDEDNVLDQTEAIDNLLYNEGVSINRQTDEIPEVTNAKTLRDIADLFNLDDTETKGLTLLQSEPYTAVTYLEDQPELMKALAYRINHNRDLQRANPWKNLKHPENQIRFPPENSMYKDVYKPIQVKGKYATFTLPPRPTQYKIAPEETSINLPYIKYSSKAKNTSFDPIQQELSQPLDSLSKNIRDELNRIPYKSKNQRNIEKALYNMTDEEDRLYNTNNLPGLETEIDPYTGYTKDNIYKYAEEPHFSRSGNVFDYFDEEDFIRNLLESR